MMHKRSSLRMKISVLYINIGYAFTHRALIRKKNMLYSNGVNK